MDRKVHVNAMEARHVSAGESDVLDKHIRLGFDLLYNSAVGASLFFFVSWLQGFLGFPANLLHNTQDKLLTCCNK